MRSVAIRVEGLGKRYRLGERQRYYALRDAMIRLAKAPLRAARNGSTRDDDRHLWALKDVSFELERGEVLGVIGRNGAGKSTLLKVLSRITEPSEGYAEVHGRVGSLLEVGTGFHPELTGRENVYLNGAILGMKRAEIQRKLDEIVAFAEVERFVDTPVKHYSSGMHLRLAFAVAAHLEPEVLIVDEVLAVGDAEFQKRCLGRMQSIGQSGRTVLFVSHSMSAVRQLCTRSLVLRDGSVEYHGATELAIQCYLAHSPTACYEHHAPSEQPAITAARAEWTREHALRVVVRFRSPFALTPPVLGIVLYDATGTPVFGSNGRFDLHDSMPTSMSSGTVTIAISTQALRDGTYSLSLWLGDQYQDYCALDRVLSVDLNTARDSSWAPPPQVIGSVRLPTEWEYADDA